MPKNVSVLLNLFILFSLIGCSTINKSLEKDWREVKKKEQEQNFALRQGSNV